MKKYKLKRVAYHEAAHGDIAYRLNPYRNFGKLTVIPKDDVLGSSVQEDIWWIDTPDAYSDEIKIFFAGCVAEKICDHWSSPDAFVRYFEGQSDTLEARELIEHHVPTMSEKELIAESERLVREHWKCIEAVAIRTRRLKMTNGLL